MNQDPAHKSTLSEFLVKFGKNVKQKRTENKWSQKELSFRSNLDKSQISAIETFSYQNLTIGTIVKISTAFEFEIEDLMK